MCLLSGWLGNKHGMKIGGDWTFAVDEKRESRGREGAWLVGCIF